MFGKPFGWLKSKGWASPKMAIKQLFRLELSDYRTRDYVSVEQRLRCGPAEGQCREIASKNGR
jgi:hypothetical protein